MNRVILANCRSWVAGAGMTILTSQSRRHGFKVVMTADHGLTCWTKSKTENHHHAWISIVLDGMGFSTLISFSPFGKSKTFWI